MVSLYYQPAAAVMGLRRFVPFYSEVADLLFYLKERNNHIKTP